MILKQLLLQIFTSKTVGLSQSSEAMVIVETGASWRKRVCGSWGRETGTAQREGRWSQWLPNCTAKGGAFQKPQTHPPGQIAPGRTGAMSSSGRELRWAHLGVAEPTLIRLKVQEIQQLPDTGGRWFSLSFLKWGPRVLECLQVNLGVHRVSVRIFKFCVFIWMVT